MILTKKQIIVEVYKNRGQELPEKVLNFLYKRISKYSEKEFSEYADSELNFKLDPIRKNQYLV